MCSRDRDLQPVAVDPLSRVAGVDRTGRISRRPHRYIGLTTAEHTESEPALRAKLGNALYDTSLARVVDAETAATRQPAANITAAMLG